MLSEFYIATEDFESKMRQCTRALVSWTGVHYIQQHRMFDLAQDLLSFKENIVRAHINATMWSVDSQHEALKNIPTKIPDINDLQAYISGNSDLEENAKLAVEAHLKKQHENINRMIRRNNSRAATLEAEAISDLKSAYKVYFIFIRAFHDACYGVLLNTNGSTPGDYSSMAKVMKKKSGPVFNKIITIPGYVKWFTDFKEKRDIIKLGVNFSLCGPQWDVGVGFNEITRNGGVIVNVDPNVGKFRLSDLITAFNYSTALLNLILNDVNILLKNEFVEKV